VARFRVLQGPTPWLPPAEIQALTPPLQACPHPFGYQGPQQEQAWEPSAEPGKLDRDRLDKWEGHLIGPLGPMGTHFKRDESEGGCLLSSPPHV
jgi:hypothetical protein